MRALIADAATGVFADKLPRNPISGTTFILPPGAYDVFEAYPEAVPPEESAER